MDNLRIVPGAGYSGEGISLGLARGLLVFYGDCNLTGEGMGIGSIAVRDRHATYFSRSTEDSMDEGGVFRRTFTLDTRMRWSIRGRPSGLLTRGIESGISTYMRHPRIQALVMLPVPLLRRLLGIHPLFETIPSPGSVTFSYRITGQQVTVGVQFDFPARSGMTVCVLNELSGAWFTAGWNGERPVSPPPGWEKVGPGQVPVSLVDPVHGVRFFMDPPSASPPRPLTVYKGREHAGDASWAGFCIELGPQDDLQELPEVRYCVGFTTGAVP